MFPCPECKTILSLEEKNTEGLLVCHRCQGSFLTEFFPALTAEEETATAQPVLNKGESSCFYHTDKIAVQTCDHCGRLLCDLCKIPVKNKNLCPTCMAKGKDQTATVTALKSNTMHDSIVLSVSLLSFLVFPVTIVVAPVVYFLILKNYRKDLGPIPRWKWRYWLAGLVATSQLAGWTFFFTSIMPA